MVIVFYPISVFVDPKPYLVVESGQCFSELIETTETIDSLLQQELLYKNLENYAEGRRGKPDVSMLVAVTEAAVALVEMQTQLGDLSIQRRVILQRKWLWRQVRMVDGRYAHNSSMTVKTRISKTGLQAVRRTSLWKLTGSEAQGGRTMID